MSNDTFTLNKEKGRFELDYDGQIAVIEYILNKDNIMFLTHTEVPVSLEGKGIGSKIVVKALEYIEEHQYKLAPLCPFVSAYMRRHPEWQRLLADGYKV